MRRPALLLLLACLTTAFVRADEPAKGPDPTEVARFPAAEAVQGVAVDAEFLYVIADHALGKYRKADGTKVATWTAPKESKIKHLNAGVVVAGKLYCAHSNFPLKPDESSVEIFDAKTLQPIGQHAFAQPPGSLTWALPYRGGWLTCFAHYSLTSDNALSRIVQYDHDWKELQRWSFPAALLKRFARSSSSGACLVGGERLLVSGHDARELYALTLPPSGGEARWDATLGFLTAGQAFDLDPAQSGPDKGFTLFSIERKSKEVVGARYPASAR
jgi:hypothetical protein